MSAKRRALRTPQRYQLTKHALVIVQGGHPWIFRDQLSSAASALADGQWLALYDAQNQVVGHGIYQSEGAVAIRILARGPERPTAASLGLVVDVAVGKRAPLREHTEGVRWLHGENDGIPGVVVDGFGPVLVVQAYAPGIRGLARWAAARVARQVGATTIVEKPPKRSRGAVEGARLLRGTEIPEVVRFREDTLTLVASPGAGQKSGTFLDLRGLRRELAGRALTGARVLDLFSYTGGLGLAAEKGGAAAITHVDASEAALMLGEAHHTIDPAKHTWIEADVFDWLKELDPAAQFDVVIVDPPSMTSSVDQVPKVIATYRRLYQQASKHVAPGGLLVACCCTSRIARSEFRHVVGATLGNRFVLDRERKPELDHPVAFPQADYLKILVFKSRARAA